MKVFLSSTAQDLVAYRQVADDTILRVSQQSVAMEPFGPLPGEPVEECERKARESDLVVCIVAHRYGFVPEKGRGSITRREVEAAKAAGKDVLVWIVADDHPWTEKREQDLLDDPTVLVDPTRVAENAQRVAALRAFKTWLRETFVCDTFTTPDELGRKIAVTLSKYAAGLCRRRVLYTLRDRGEVLARDLIARAPQPGAAQREWRHAASRIPGRHSRISCKTMVEGLGARRARAGYAPRPAGRGRDRGLHEPGQPLQDMM